MKKLIKNWDELLPYEKVCNILAMVFAVATIVLAILSYRDKTFLSIAQISAGFNVLCLGMCFWRRQRGTAILNLCVSLIVVVIGIVTLFL